MRGTAHGWAGWLVCLASLATGCYAEVALGGHAIVTGRDTPEAAWTISAAAGFFIEPAPVHVAVGIGGDQLQTYHQDAEFPPANQLHTAMGIHTRLGIGIYDLDETASVWIDTSAAYHYSDFMLTVDAADPNVEDRTYTGHAFSGWLGPAFRFWFGLIGLRLGVGPSVFYSAADGFAETIAVGGQVRYMVYGWPDFDNMGDFGALWRNGYDAEAGRRSLERDMRRHDRNMQQHRENQCIRDPNCRLVPR